MFFVYILDYFSVLLTIFLSSIIHGATDFFWSIISTIKYKCIKCKLVDSGDLYKLCRMDVMGLYYNTLTVKVYVSLKFLYDEFFWSGKTDPFVVLSLGDQVMRSKKNSQTTVIGRPGEPIWNQVKYRIVFSNFIFSVQWFCTDLLIWKWSALKYVRYQNSTDLLLYGLAYEC